MDRLFKISLFLLAILGTTLSSAAFGQAQAVRTKPFVAPPGEPIKTIALLKIDEPWGYFLGEGAHSAFGLGGLLVSTFKRPKHPEYENAGFRFSAVAERVLTAHLKAAGFKVISVSVKREKPYQLLRKYKALSVPNVDAYLDVVSGGVGYRTSDTGTEFAQKVGPYVVISVRLVSARSKKVLYADTIEYAWRKGHRKGLPGSEIDAPDDQIFADAEAVDMDLLSGDRSRSLAQLTHGVDVAMRRVVSEFSAYPAMVLPQQAGSTPRTDSPIDVSKAAPATRPDKERELLRSIAGKWRGDGTTVGGGSFSLKIVFREDGSMDYSWSSNTNSDRGARPPGTLRVNGDKFEYKSKNGLLWIVTLHKDKKGRQILKARREDGNQWRLKRKR